MQPSSNRTKHELRCICVGQPLLAVYGVDRGELYIHIKVYKAKRLYHESVITEGKVRIHCRNCSRWHRIRIRMPNKAELEPDKRPDFLTIQ